MKPVLLVALVAILGGCASDGDRNYEPRDGYRNDPRDWKDMPGFTPFSS